MPGIAASTRLTCELGSAPNSVEAPENNFDLDDDLGVDFHADDHFPAAGHAFDQLRSRLRRAHGVVHQACGLLRKSAAYLDRAARPQHGCFVEGFADHLKPERNPSLESPAGTEMPGSPARLSGTVNTSFRYIETGSAVFSPSAKAVHGVDRRKQDVAALESVGEVARDQVAHPLRAQIIGVVISRRQNIGADHDAAEDFAAEAFGAALLVELDQIVGVLGAASVAHAVVAREIGRGFGRRHDVVGRRAHILYAAG